MDFVFFVYGLAFVLMAVVLAALDRLSTGGPRWEWLARFGLLHGVNEWLDMLAYLQIDFPLRDTLRLSFLAVSFACLVEFGRSGAGGAPRRRVGRWIHLPLLATAAAGAAAGPAGMNATSRYALGLVGALWSARTLLAHARSDRTAPGAHRTAAGAMAAYAALTGLVVPRAHFFPADVLHHDSFLAATGVPIQVLRCAAACVASFSLWRAYLARHDEAYPRIDVEAGLAPQAWFAAAFALALAAGWAGTVTVGRYLHEHEMNGIRAVARSGAAAINPRRISTIAAVGVPAGHPDLVRLDEQLRLMKTSNPIVHCATLLVPAGGDLRAALSNLEAGCDDERAEVCLYEKDVEEIGRRALETGGDLIERGEARTGHPFFLSAAPIRDLASGHPVAALVFEADARPYENVVRRGRLGAVLITLLVALLLCAGFVLWQRGVEARHEIAARERLLNDAERIARIGSWDLDLSTNRFRWSDETYRIFEVDPVRFTPTYENAVALIHPDDRAVVERGYAESIRNRIPFSTTHRLRMKDGRVKHVHEICQTHYDAARRPIRSVGTVQDVTERLLLEAEAREGHEAVRRLNLELEERVRRRTAELEAANRELEAFSYSVSHDLRAPLRSVDGFAQALSEDCADRLDEAGRAHLARIRAAAQRMGLLIDDLIALSRVARQVLEVRDVDLSALAREAGEEVRARYPGRDVSFTVADDLTARGDPKLLRLVLENLLDNAWKFTAQTPAATIEVGAEAEGDRRVFLVRDNGAGFEMRHADRLFSPFQRLHTTRDFPGTGIGLSIVERIVRRHGGEIRADAEPGRGATFRFRI